MLECCLPRPWMQENLKDYEKPFEHMASSVYSAYTAELAKMSSV